jgi:nitrite reductase (NADH) small subunit
MREPHWHKLGKVEDFPSGSLRGMLIQRRRLCVGRAGTRYFALDDTCPHAGGSLCEGLLDADLVICPLHAYGFEVDSGRCRDDEACSVSSYDVRVEDGTVQIRF